MLPRCTVTNVPLELYAYRIEVYNLTLRALHRDCKSSFERLNLVLDGVT